MLLRHSLPRFLLSGACNTLATYLLYALLLQAIGYRWAYSAAFACGVVLSYGLQRWFVFRRSGGTFGPLWVAAIYLLQYLLGIALVTLWVRGLGLAQILAPAFAIVLTLPCTYLASRRVFRG